MRLASLLAVATVLLAGCGQKQSAAPARKDPANVAEALDAVAVPMYPGAKPAGGAGFALGQAQPGERRLMATLTVPDKPEAVVKFYRSQLRMEPVANDKATQFVGKTKNGSDVILFVEPHAAGAKITVRGILYEQARTSG